jgi:hypothetical protein
LIRKHFYKLFKWYKQILILIKLKNQEEAILNLKIENKNIILIQKSKILDEILSSE